MRILVGCRISASYSMLLKGLNLLIQPRRRNSTRGKMRENLQKLYRIGSDKFSWNAEIIHLLQLLKATENLLTASMMQKFCILFSC